MKATRAIPILLTLLLCASPVTGREIAESDVRAAVETWVRNIGVAARPDAVVQRMQPRREGGRIVAYVAHLSGGGFCLAGADDLLLPVYYYCPDADYDPTDPNLEILLDEIAERSVAHAELLSSSADPDVVAQLSDRPRQWQQLSLGIAPYASIGKAAPQSIDLPLTSTWDQGSPYNDLCPILPVIGNPMTTLTGCVATSLAQVMYYWKWPNTGSGSHSVDYEYRWRNSWDEEPLATNPGIGTGWANRLDWVSTNGGRLRMNGTWDISVYNSARNISNDPDYATALEALWNRMTVVTNNYSANFGATTYNWGIMPDAPTDPPTPATLEVAKLSHHAGIAFDMSYGIWFSGSDVWRAEVPMETYFKYDTDSSYGNTDIDAMTEEIEWHRPFVLSGGNGLTAHAWVVYGYDKSTDPNRLFHMNMGWGGTSDGWYTKDAVPQNLTACCQRQFTHLAPDGPVRFVGGSAGGDGSPADPYPTLDTAVQAAPDGARLIFRSGTTHTVASNLTITRPFTLEGTGVTIR